MTGGRPLTVGSLCTGYGGLEAAVALAFGNTSVVFVADTSPGAVALLAHRAPDVPNSRSAVWFNVADAVRILRPGLVVLENVAALLGRGMGRVVGDLAEIGYVGSWVCVRASDVGAPHKRARIFIVAWPADSPRDAWRVAHGDGGDAAGDGVSLLPTPVSRDRGRQGANGRGPLLPEVVATLLPTPTMRDGKSGPGHAVSAQGSPDLRTMALLLPTPNSALGRGAGFPSPELAAARRGEGRRFLDDAVSLLPTPLADRISTRMDTPLSGDGRTTPNRLGWAVAALLPTPKASEGTKGSANQRGSGGDLTLTSTALLLPTPVAGQYGHNRSGTPGASPRPSLDTLGAADRWGEFAPAIARWEQVQGRPAPDATEIGPAGNRRLAARFVEWMQGVGEGWVTGVPGLSRNRQLQLLGNGVVPLQGALALREALPS